MRISTICLFVITAGTLIYYSEGGECSLDAKTLKKSISTLNKKCLKNGFETVLPGCISDGDPSKLKKKQIKKCTKVEKKLEACGWGCPVDGDWGSWGPWGDCSAKCEGGERKRERECANPVPSNGGAECDGHASQTEVCNTHSCAYVYTLIQTTGTGKNQNSKGKFLFTLRGTKGNTNPHECPTDRELGQTSKCSFEDSNEIGEVQSLVIENKSKDMWTFTRMSVDVDGVLKGIWRGPSKEVKHYSTVSIPFTKIGEAVQYTIRHKTGNGQWDGGKTTGAYVFAIIGTKGRTSGHDCAAGRGKGVTSECTFEDKAVIGDITHVKIRNKTGDMWSFVWLTVNNLAAGAGRVNDYKTITLPLR